jgi:hypothetical protein
MRRLLAAAVMATAASTLMTGVALADNDDLVCTEKPEAEWLPLDQIEAKLVAAGYEVRKVKAEEHCAEAYVITPEHEKAELYLDPTTGEIVDQDVD